MSGPQSPHPQPPPDFASIASSASGRQAAESTPREGSMDMDDDTMMTPPGSDGAELAKVTVTVDPDDDPEDVQMKILIRYLETLDHGALAWKERESATSA
jgi:hypothetical protein